MKINPSSKKYKLIQLNNDQDVKIATFFSLRLFMSFDNLVKNDNKGEMFRNLISNARIIRDFSEEDYKTLSEEDLSLSLLKY